MSKRGTTFGGGGGNENFGNKKANPKGWLNIKTIKTRLNFGRETLKDCRT
jgi:hypothetical protein